MATSMSAFSSILKSNNFLIYQPIFKLFFHQTTQLTMDFIFNMLIFLYVFSFNLNVCNLTIGWERDSDGLFYTLLIQK